MQTAKINGAQLEYEVQGSGEPALMISTGPIADSFLPFFSQERLVEHYRLIRYRQRGIANPQADAPVSFEQHAEDAAALLRHLGIDKAHVAGHSTGASIALQLAMNHPDLVQTLILLETPLLMAPSAGAFFERAGPALAAYEAGDKRDAMTRFLSVVCSLEWERCHSVIDNCVPGGAELAIENADNFFRSYLPALSAWSFGPEQAKAISQPVLSVLGSATDQLFKDGHELLRTWIPQLEACNIEGAAHLLHMQRPEAVIQGVAAFLGRHPMSQ